MTRVRMETSCDGVAETALAYSPMNVMPIEMCTGGEEICYFASNDVVAGSNPAGSSILLRSSELRRKLWTRSSADRARAAPRCGVAELACSPVHFQYAFKLWRW